jgi:hypothetical protein
MKSLSLIILAVLLCVPQANADRRKYAWTYQFATIEPNATELEFYQTTKLSTTDKWEYRLEVEHGLTPRSDIAVYQIFSQAEGGPFKWDAFQIRGRYKLAEAGQLWVDPLIYLEYNRKTDLTKQNKLEAKLILSKRIGSWDVSANPMFEFFWAPGEPIHEPGLDLGVSYELNYRFTMGLESVSRWKYQDGADDKHSSYFGPTISLASGSVFYTVGYLAGLTDDSDDTRVRFLMGVRL